MAAAAWHAVARLEDLEDGRLRPVAVGGEMVLLLRRGAEVLAVAALCPHKSTGLEDGALADGRVACPLHGASFDLATGEPLAGQAWAGRLPVYPARVREGAVEVQADTAF